ncbi:hypothetical protein P43SY_001146 [Pythium insidiosum]|uniref:Kinesin motor domain-containing protein n=1 Tax=Pythium insidiosum TaxID=114742 RepID=A0AAD5L9G1_PYTIN|nr:hypothetical protein P43SY_001146 [Pythium insidiosum]
MEVEDIAPGSGSKDKETVKVVVRCRPFSSKETNEGRKSIITIDSTSGLVAIRCPENDQVKSFTFDSVYDESTTQRQFYDESGYPLVESIFEGYNGTIFAYGQTGCGKTHTMQGKDNPPELRGVIPNSFDHIFETIQADPSKEYMVRASYLEIYNEEIRDLLSDDQKRKLDLKEAADGSVFVKELTEVVVSDVDSINRVMNKGFKNRTVGATLMNEGSSRSHSIFTVVVEVSEKIDGEDRFKAGKLNLVDLAGSERQSKTGATGNRLKEGCKINLSLSALGNVISALVDGKGKHIPYRDSKLTRLLQDSLGGNTKTLMVAAISPADYNYDETLSTLRYANRAKNIKNKPVVNEDPKDAKLREYKEEIERLKKLLETSSQSRGSAVGTLSGVSTPSRPFSPASIVPIDTAALEIERAKEREEIARYQREAAEMMERARRMMEEAKDPSTTQQAPATSPALQPQPPVHPKPQTPPSPPREDPAITRALQEAAQVDAQAKAMMAKAEQMLREAESRAKQPPKVKIVKEVVVKEVIPDAHIKEKAELHQKHQAMLDQQQRIGRELERAQQAMESHLREKEDLQQKLKKIEGQILGGTSSRQLNGQPVVDSEIALLKQQVEYRRTQLKLKEKAKREAQFEAAQRTLTLEKQMIEEELRTAQETAQANLAAAKKRESRYKAKLEAARQEVIDLNNEFERERENLLDTIREQTKETKLLEQLVELFLPQNELIKVWERAVWSDDREEWVLPKIKPRSDFQKLKLPSLSMNGQPQQQSTEWGGAEVISDGESSPTAALTLTGRSVGSSSGSKRPKTSSKGTARLPHDDAASNQQPQVTHRLLSPTAHDHERGDAATRRLPATTTRVSSKDDALPEASIPSEKPKSSKKKDGHSRRRSKDSSKASAADVDGAGNRSPGRDDVAAAAGSSLRSPRSPQSSSSLHSTGRPLFPGEDDHLAPLEAVPDGYQPRDRLQSRQGSRHGSRQGSRSVDRSSLSGGSSQSGLGEFELPKTATLTVSSATATPPTITNGSSEKPPLAGRSGSRHGGSRSRSRTRKQRSSSSTSDSEMPETAFGSAVEPTESLEHSPDASLIKKKSKSHKKKRERKEREDTPPDTELEHQDEHDLLNDLGHGFFLPPTSTSSSSAPRSRRPPDL